MKFPVSPSLLSILLIISTFYLAGRTSRLNAQKSWSIQLPRMGTLSSPRVSDLNQDGVGDIIMGAGRLEFQKCDSAVIAIDGKNGALLWNVKAKDQIFGSAAFKDINSDGIEDVFIGGRSAELKAINGSNGELIWQFFKKNRGKDKKKIKWFNFYNPQFIPDQDQDGLEDILISNGGDVKVEPYNTDRPAGRLVIISSRDGSLIAEAEMPDGKEIYMSITVSETPDGKDHEVVFGTGGETVGGNLYVSYLSDILQEDLSKAILLDSSKEKGYIGPPVRVDITGDHISDIVTCSVDGRLMAFDGNDHKRLWETFVPKTESYSTPAVGYFTQDSIPDFFLSFSQGVWPNQGWSIQKMVDGKTGEVAFTDSLGFYQNTSPLAVDLNGDGWDEILMSGNFKETKNIFQKFFYTMLVKIDFQSDEVVQIGDTYEGNNITSTPWTGDLDQDGFLDILYCHSTNVRHTYNFNGMRITRIATKTPIYKTVKWGAYQGSKYDGVYRQNEK